MPPPPTPPTFALQQTLPRLPIPPVQQTLALYLQTIRPFCASDKDYAETEAHVKQFVASGAAAQLQERLLAHDKTQPGSWLSNWWLALAYHSWRESVLVNSNWYIIFRNADGAESADQSGPRDFTALQVKRAANLTAGCLDYKDRIDNEQLPIEMTKAGPICMNQYRNVFGVTRVPKKDCDYNFGTHPCHFKHICVSIRNQFYALQVYVGRNRLTAEAIEKQLWKIIEAAKKTSVQQPAVGILTAEHRDTWSLAHEHLEKLDPQNKTSFSIIESAIFNLALDEFLVGPSTDSLAKYVFHNFDGSNRWFDKSITLCVSADGRAGANGEHSPLDALVCAYLMDYAVKENKQTTPEMVDASLFQPIAWVVDTKAKEYIANAQVFAKNLIADSDVKVLNFRKFGTDFIKKEVGTSPDAFMQMALQLTFFRMHGHFPAVYETASTRKYLYGRTETGRSMSIDSANFIKTFNDTSASPTKKVEALKIACKNHVDYLSKAGNGFGVDRHLLGLRLVMKPGESYEIFKDPVFARSSHWDLSTSGLFSSKNVVGTGFGTVYPDGYGMNYALHSGNITIGVESKTSNKKTDTAAFCSTLEKVLEDMQTVVLAAVSETKAKL
ncbi:acyltransferase ChoActase/COT/CPT [Obelidium mucronatum]|nr:acyltransferase ChoActase/COT/CPT [Obelidium mucronatum]